MISLCVGGLLMKEIATKTQDEKKNLTIQRSWIKEKKHKKALRLFSGGITRVNYAKSKNNTSLDKNSAAAKDHFFPKTLGGKNPHGNIPKCQDRAIKAELRAAAAEAATWLSLF